MVPVSIIDQNKQAQSYTQLQIKKTYIALKLRNLYHNKTARIKNFQKNRLQILWKRSLYGETQI